MKVLFVAFEFGNLILGGLGRVVNGLKDELRRTVDVDVYHLYFDFSRLRFSAKLYRCDRESGGRLIATFDRGSVWRNCIELAKRERYDLLHFFQVHPTVGKMVDLLAAELPAQRYVYSVHSVATYEQGTRRNPASFLAAENKLVRGATVVHVLNQATKQAFERGYPDLATDKSMWIIPNAVRRHDFEERDPAFAERLGRRLRPGVPTVVCMSRWAHGKGLEYYVEAASKLRAQGRDVQFVLAGRKYISWEKNWYAYLFKIQRMAARVGSSFVVLGWLNSAQRNTLFGAADAVVMPSELEYYPYSVLEPAAFGLPLVCSNLPCVGELLHDGRDCLFFDVRDSSDLARKIDRVVESPELGKALSDGARRRVAQMPGWPEVAAEYARMYSAITSEGEVARPRGAA
jgi:glycosyltransferase involved in cell wall biosynthesis